MQENYATRFAVFWTAAGENASTIIRAQAAYYYAKSCGQMFNGKAPLAIHLYSKDGQFSANILILIAQKIFPKKIFYLEKNGAVGLTESGCVSG